MISLHTPTGRDGQPDWTLREHKPFICQSCIFRLTRTWWCCPRSRSPRADLCTEGRRFLSCGRSECVQTHRYSCSTPTETGSPTVTHWGPRVIDHNINSENSNKTLHLMSYATPFAHTHTQTDLPCLIIRGMFSEDESAVGFFSSYA